MGVFQRNTTKKASLRQISPEMLIELRRLPYAEDFSLPQEAAKLSRVYEHDTSGGSFEIRKTMAGRIKYSPVVAIFDKFPSETHILEVVYENFGGGQYSIHLQGQPGAIKTFHFPGKSKFHPQGSPPKTVLQELQDESARYAAEFLEKEIRSGSEIGRHLQQALVAKTYGIELPAESTYEEKVVEEFLEDHPELRDAYAKELLRKQGVRIPEEKTEIESLMDGVRQMGKLKESIAKFERAGEPEPNLLRDAIQGLATVAPDVVKLLIGPKAKPAQVPDAPLTPVSEPQAVKGSEAMQEPTELRQVAAPESTTARPTEAATRPPQQSDRLDKGKVGQSQLDQVIDGTGNQPQAESPGQSTSPEPDTMHSVSATLRKQFTSSVNWAGLERAINRDPSDYVEHLRDKAQEHGTGYDAVLGCLLDPARFLEALSEAVERLLDQPGGGEDYESAVLIQRQLNETEEGRQWLEEARAAAIITYEGMALDIKMTDACDAGNNQLSSEPTTCPRVSSLN